MSDDWRLRVTLAGSEHAGALTARLEATELSDEAARELGDAVVVSHDGAAREGVSHVRRWRYVLVGAADGTRPQAWARRLRDESPPGTEVRSEGTFAFIARMSPTPFKGIAALGGGVV